ncbi:unnamed protein product [Prunus brigantina]
MGDPEAEYQGNVHDQPQMEAEEVEFELQDQQFEYQQVPDTGDSVPPLNYDNQNQHDQYQQQQQQPQPQPPNQNDYDPQPQPQPQVVFQQTQQPSQPQPMQFPPLGPPQPNPYQTQPQQFPPQSPQQFPPQRPQQFPPQSPQQFPPQRPQQFPPQNSQQFPPQSPQQFPPQSPQQFPPQRPQQYPPQSPQFQAQQQQQQQQQQGYQQPQMTPQPGAAAQFPPQNVQSHPNPNPMYGNGANQPGAYPPQAPQQSPAKFPPASPSTPHQVRYQQQQPQQAQAGYINVNAGNANAMPDNNYAAQGVPVQQPHYQPGPLNHINLQNVGTEGWSSELFDCMDDPMNALTTAFVPCLTFGQIAEIVDNGTTSCAISGLFYGLIASFLGVPFIMSCTYRTKLRSMFGLVEAPAPDWVTHLFCEPCALCQEYRELQIRGIDPSIGWIGNLQRNPNLQQQLRANMMAPPPPQYMNHNCQ